MSIDFNELRDLLGAIAQTDITELSLKTDAFELSVRKNAGQAPGVVPVTPIPEAIAAPAGLTEPASPPPPVPVAELPKETPTPSAIDQKWTAVTSPMVGTFYRAPSPDEAPFVEIGDTIRKGQPVCIIEAMKLMNEIEAEISGQVMEIAVANGEPVEYGQTLLWVKPA
ncbi:MAG: acetyl-CoA carboxylase biotin carboxyl carrier protein [Snowella sp.]